MGKATVQHPNASLTPRGRLRMVKLVIDQGWPAAAVAERFQVDPKTVRKWRDRFLAEGPDGLRDRSSRPRRSPARTPERTAGEVRRLRVGYRWVPARIGYQVGLAASTVHRIITDAGLGRLDQGDRTPPQEEVVRYQRERPGELVHIDVKKLAGIPDGGGWRIHGKGRAGPSQRVGYRYIHSALDDRTRTLHTEMLGDETAATAAGFLERTVRKFNQAGIQTERVITDNGPRLPIRAVGPDLRPVGRQTQTHPPLPAPDQRQGRALPPHPARGMGLHQALDVGTTTQRSPAALHPLLQSPPTPRSTRMGHTHQNPTSTHQGQPTRAAQIGPTEGLPPCN